ncbi:guanine deaminase [Microbulbifer sp. VAAF005]|uniref:guanine deaminase n=1 Tax=Microbulbifer sp. VAAF005 TaxID=3034230 RepID=UPI0024AE13E5|nr:guanine deaminase [Microbulbifer sp. VAAF005]WHI44863.1 guanine deaminase [Microbulbifer sp. VAAF005]
MVEYLSLSSNIKSNVAKLFLLLSASSNFVYAETTIFQGDILHFTSDPAKTSKAYEYIEDGGLIVKDGIIAGIISEEEISVKKRGAEIVDYRGKLILPGFIDSHIHYPQTGMIAAHGEQLLEWLKEYTFPTERKFSDKEHAKEVAEFFISQLLKNGTTSALVFGTVHPESVDALFEVAQRENMRLIAGKVLMDRNAPEYLQDTPQSAYSDSKKLIERWHNKDRLSYAITPRFAPTSTPEQLKQAAKLLDEYPDVYMHTHVSENKDEINWVKSLFPEANSYLDVYNIYGLNRDHSVFAHGIYLDDKEMESMASVGSAIAFCPTSNLFLGSGLFPLNRGEEINVSVGLGTDVGAGTSFSMLETMDEAYKVVQLQKSIGNNNNIKTLSPLKAFYLATLGSAKALDIDDKVGNFEKGKEADFIVIDLKSTDLMDFRMKSVKTLEEKLFALQVLGDDRAIYSTYIMGDKK